MSPKIAFATKPPPSAWRRCPGSSEDSPQMSQICADEKNRGMTRSIVAIEICVHLRHLRTKPRRRRGRYAAENREREARDQASRSLIQHPASSIPANLFLQSPCDRKLKPPHFVAARRSHASAVAERAPHGVAQNSGVMLPWCGTPGRSTKFQNSPPARLTPASASAPTRSAGR
jgi:hypothetical protein